MNIGEANAVNRLVEWVLDLAMFEHRHPGVVVPNDELVRIIGYLADRTSTALGAGMRQGDAIAAAMHLLEMDEVTADEEATP